ncbi:putative serine/threonine-protein kinase SIS8 isoform X2 [Bidens hawaiensis]|uniref:putative serine/threonine-protein kinase SIS8 isoform X2 n=1 Tax=Bidens hawaiensis TaxID=980011 RepID=UPI004049AA74
MKNLLKKLHMMPNQASDVGSEGSNKGSSKGNQSSGNLNVKDEDNKSEERIDCSMAAEGLGDLRVEDEGYQIQLALELSAREDPEAVQIEAVKQISLGSSLQHNTPAQVLAYRYRNYSALSYDDKILDGFYDLYEASPTGLLSEMPSLTDLQQTPVSDNITWEAVVVNKGMDDKLLQLEKSALEICMKSKSKSTSESDQDAVQRLGVLVSNHMGGPVADPDKMLVAWNSFSYKLKVTLGSMVLPLGSLKVGMARHRALLFKVLADSVGIACCLVKGKQYTGSTDVAMNFIKIDDGREYIIDLMADPGTLIPSHIDHNESSSSSSPWSRDDDTSRSRVTSSQSGQTTSSEECLDFEAHQNKIGELPIKSYNYSHARSPSWTEGVSSPAARKMKVKDVSQYMIDAAKENPHLAQKLHDVLLESGVVAPPNLFNVVYDEHEDRTMGQSQFDRPPRFLPSLPLSQSKVPVAAAAAAAAVVASSMVVAATRSTNDPNVDLPVAAAATVTAAAVVATGLPNFMDGQRRDGEGQFGNLQSGENDVADSLNSEVSLDDVADCEIAWEEITLGERIGLGSYGEVYRGDWHGTEVAVKRFLDQQVTVESLEEFRSEVGIMKRVRHPNVVLFMGAVTRAPHLSIVTEFLPRGSLYRLIHRPNNQLDIRRRLRIALHAARGMNYLHNCTPVIVHRDLKSPNLLVDKNWVVKVGDFGLSRMKHSTFLSSRSTAGTAEWMAPEVLRNEPSDEKLV